MRPSTANAIKTLLRMDRTVTEKERTAVIAAMTESKAEGLARVALDGAWMKSSDVCTLLDINRSTLARWIKEGTLAGKKRGKCYYVATESVRALVADLQEDRESRGAARGNPSTAKRGSESGLQPPSREAVAQEGTRSNTGR